MHRVHRLCARALSRLPSPKNVVADVEPIARAGSWYDPNSIERRLRRKRGDAPVDAGGAPIGRAGLSVGAMTEEEAYALAGAPGYEGADRTPRTEAEPSRVSESADALRMKVASSAPASAPAAESADADRIAPLVRISTGIVSRAALPGFVRTWQLLALPVYRSAAGCASARLLVGEHRADEDAAPAETRVRFAGPRGGLAVVTAVTEWDDDAALNDATSTEAYASAMEQLAVHFRGVPTVATLGQEGANAYTRIN
jgi:hypothetical protein